MSLQEKTTMSSSSDILRFHFPTYGDSILCKMDALREERRFCDITLLLGGPQGTTIQPLHFHGHRVVLAASSDFLRDQFLLHEGLAELNVGVVSSVEVGKRLLLSCYTGLLEVPLRELVSYLTAASALQMSQVVEKCVQAVSQYLSPTLAFLKPERHSEEKTVQKLYSLHNQEQRHAPQPSFSVLRASTEEGGVVEANFRISQEARVDSQGLKEVRDKRVFVAKTELSADAACCLKSEEGVDIPPVHTNKPSDKDSQINPESPKAVQDPVSFPTRGGSNKHEELVDGSQNRGEEAWDGQGEEEEMFLLAAQLQDCRELMNSQLFCLSGAPKSNCSGNELTDDSDGIMVHRPYLCRRCDRVFQHLESYLGHLKEHRQYLCLVCGKGFSQRSNLTHHIRVHTGVKPFRCPLCHKTFSQKATLQDHLNLHTGDKPHKCNYCALHFTQKPGLRRHLKDIHGKSSLQNVLEEALH